MADGIAITAGTGTTILTDDTGVGGHAQVMKLAISTDGSGTLIPADGTDGLLVNLGANNDVTVSGVSTAANQTTMIGHLDGVEGLLTTIDADTGTLAGAVAGTEMQVDIVAALPAGTNNIGDVDVLSVVPGTAATNLGKAEDAAHADSDVGVMALAIRDDTGATHTVSAAGDYTPLATDYQGRLWTANQPALRNGLVTTRHTNITTAVTNTAMGPTINAGTRLCVTRLTVTLDTASTVFPTVLIGFATATTPTGDGVIAYHGGLPAGGGFTIGDGSAVIGAGASDEELRITTTGNATGNGLSVSFTYFTMPT